MALSPVRFEYRLTLAHVDRQRERAETVIASRHPSETQTRLTLRMLAFCLLNEDGLAFGPGLSTPDTPDLWTHDLTGTLRTWIQCGTASAEQLRKVQQHHPGIAVHVVFDEPRRTDALLLELGHTRLPRSASAPLVWTIDSALVTRLAAHEQRRQRWNVTIVSDHLYVDSDGESLDGAVERRVATSAR